MKEVKIYTIVSDQLSPPITGESFCTDMVRHSDYAELEAKCVALVAENHTARNAVQTFCDVVGANTDAICEEVGQDGVRGILAEVRASARNEHQLCRLAAAFNHGFLDKPVSEVLDVTRMILSAKEDLANDPLPADDGLSGEYAEKSIEEWAAQLRKGAAQ